MGNQIAANGPEAIGLEGEIGAIAGPLSGYPDMAEVNPSVVLVAPTYAHLRNLRRTLESQHATILREYTAYPSYAHLPSILELDCDAVLVEIDSDMDLAMELVEAICDRKPLVTVMVYSGTQDPDRMVRSMRAGAREFLAGSFSPGVLQDALLRAAARRVEQSTKRAVGKLLVFWGVKGGAGVTTLATNFALALRAETASEVALLDLHPHLGDVAVLLGMTPRFTLTEALGNARRLDQEFVSTLVTEHSSGVSVLAAPDAYNSSLTVESRTVSKLVDVVRNRYPYVVIDAGRDLGNSAEHLFQMAGTIYLVTQLDIPSLRNTQRFISYLRQAGVQNVEVVVNRFEARKTEFDDERLTKALGLPPKWKVPNDYSAAHRSSNAGSPLLLERSPVAQTLRAMARAASGKPLAVEKKKKQGMSLFG